MSEENLQEEKKKDNVIRCIAEDISYGKFPDRYIYFLEEDAIMIYKEGAWQKIYDYQFLGDISQWAPGVKKFPISMVKQIVETFKTLKHVQKSVVDFNNGNYLNLTNGMLHPYTGELEDHAPEYYSTFKLDYPYVDFITQEHNKIFGDGKLRISCDLWIKTLGEILDGDVNKINLLQEFFGYCLTKDTTQHKALLLLGESRSGKSTILKTLRAMVGDKNCSSVPLKFISNPQYTPMLMNKLVNIDTDVSAKAAEFEAEFKTITSGEPVACNQKFVAAFDFIPYCKIVMAANIFPKITDHSSAFYKRLIVIPCDRVFSEKEQNKGLFDQIKEELPGILNWAIEGLKRLKERGYFEETDFSKEALEDLEDANNPANVFFRDHVEIAMNEYIEKGELFNHYKRWSEENKQWTLSAAMFSNAVFKAFHKTTPKKTNLPNGKRIWKNIRYVNFKTDVSTVEDKGWVD